MHESRAYALKNEVYARQHPTPRECMFDSRRERAWQAVTLAS
ncbi:hypothetical protein [Burkholderia arboris]|nr:hypothetical protein [Burkholderia arboris]